MSARRWLWPGLLALLAVPAAAWGLELASYSLGRPDSPRAFVGLLAVAGLGVAAVPLALAGRLLDRAGLRPPQALALVGALAVVPLVVLSVPREYDQRLSGLPLAVATAGVVLAGVVLSVRDLRRALAAGLGALGALYATCLLMDLLRP